MILSRITQDAEKMGGRPCIRGTRVTVATVVGLLAAGHSHEQILSAYLYLVREDILAALSYAAWRSQESKCFSDDREPLTAALAEASIARCRRSRRLRVSRSRYELTTAPTRVALGTLHSVATTTPV